MRFYYTLREMSFYWGETPDEPLAARRIFVINSQLFVVYVVKHRW